MSRLWNSQDEIYIYKENLKIKNATIESLINRINAKCKYDLNIINIMNIYEEKLNNIIKYLKEKDIDYFSPSYNKKSSIYEILDEYLKQSVNELTQINNKLINQKYKNIVNTKLILLLIRKNINKYNSIINEFKQLEIINFS